MSQPLHVIILAAGAGKRMKSALPKVLQPIAGRPMLAHVIQTARQLRPAGIHLVYGHGGEAVRAAFAGHDDLTWAEQAQQLGTGHAVQQAMPAIPDTAQVLVLYGDVPLIRADTLRALLHDAPRLAVLVAEELVTWDPATKRYALGNGMISLARSVLDRSGFPQLIQPVLDRLAGRFGVTAMGVEITAKGTVVVLALSHSNQPFRVHTDVGSRFDTLVSATGRLIAAHGGESWTELRKKFSQIHWDKAPRFDTWKKEVELARTQGFSVDRDNFMAGLTVVAVPVFTAGGRFAYTVVVVGLSSQLTTVATDLLAQEMMREAREISGLLVEGI